MEKITRIKDVLSKYSGLSFKDKLHIKWRIRIFPWDAILERLPPGNVLIDIGCGHGLFINLIDMNPGRFKRFVGIDLAENKIRAAKQSENERIKFHLCRIDELKETADVYSIIDVLYLMSPLEQERLISSVYSNLPEGGYLIIKEVDRVPFWKFALNYIEEIIMVKILKITLGNAFYFRSSNDFQPFLEKFGFRIKKIELGRRYLHPHFLLICQK